MYKIAEVYDTRSFDINTGKYIPGTGDPKPCDHCGKTHVVYVNISNGTNNMIVGTTCARNLVSDFTGTTTSELKANARRKILASFVPELKERYSRVDRKNSPWNIQYTIAAEILESNAISGSFNYELAQMTFN